MNEIVCAYIKITSDCENEKKVEKYLTWLKRFVIATTFGESFDFSFFVQPQHEISSGLMRRKIGKSNRVSCL